MELLRILADPLNRTDETAYFCTMFEVGIAYILDYQVSYRATIPLSAASNATAKGGPTSLAVSRKPSRAKRKVAAGARLGLTFETDFYGKGAMLRAVAPGSAAEAVIVHELGLRPRTGLNAGPSDGPALTAVNGVDVVGRPLGSIMQLLREAAATEGADTLVLEFVSSEEYYTSRRV